MAAVGSFVVVRRTISQTIVPYKDVEERLQLRRSKSKSTSLGFSSTNNVARCGVINTPDSKQGQKAFALERSRSEVCLRRKSSYARETSLDVFEERREGGLVKPMVRLRREARRVNTSRPQSDFFPEFSIKSKKNERALVSVKENENDSQDAGKRLGRCIATLRREMMSLRKQDQELLKQLTSLNQHIQDLKDIARAQGGIFGSTEDQGDVTHIPTPVTPNGPQNDNSSITKKESAKAVRKLSTGKRIKSDIEGLQETSFEYIEVPCDSPGPKPVRPKATPKRSQSTTIADSRKKVVSRRLERKSLSCQFLDSSRQDDLQGKKKILAESQETLLSKDAQKPRPLSQISKSQEPNTKQKSLSLSQLRSVTKTTEGSTSDSECSTSGCYGGSSTGSEAELERSVGYFNTRAGESSEKLDKIIELNLKPIGKSQRYLAIHTQQNGQVRKKIVSV